MQPLALLAAGLTLAFADAAGAATLKTLYGFCSEDSCKDGSFPQAGLAFDASGNLYGTTFTGGANDNGVVFQLKRNGSDWTYKVLHSFCYTCGDGAFPASRVIVDVNGNVYGTTEAAGPDNQRGIVFRLSPNADGSKWREKILHVFTGMPDGDDAATGLAYQGQPTGMLYDGVSPLYGTTGRGGATDRGAAYELVRDGRKWRERVIYSFCPNGGSCSDDGWEPGGDLFVDSTGTLYGTTLGGMNGGTVFQLSPNAKKTKWKERVLYGFCADGICDDGVAPQGQLAMDARGHLLGTTQSDSSEGGTVFELARKDGAWHEKVLHTFCQGDCKDGYLPVAGVIIDANGNLFGTNELGGNLGSGDGGTVFELSGKTFTTLYTFCSEQNCADGRIPAAPVVMDAKGHLYGTTSQGGPTSGAGTVFELSP
jgi:uncharacterized repeat protein (TIGR03803 family)